VRTYPTVSFPVKSSRAARVGGPTWSESEVVCGYRLGGERTILSRATVRVRARVTFCALGPRVGARFRARRVIGATERKRDVMKTRGNETRIKSWANAAARAGATTSRRRDVRGGVFLDNPPPPPPPNSM